MASESLKPALLLGSSASLGEAVADQGVGAVVSNTLNSIVQKPEMAAGGLAFGLLTGQGWLSGRAAAKTPLPKTSPAVKPGSYHDKPPGWNDNWEWHSSTRAKPGSDGWRWRDSQGGEWRRHVPDKHHPEAHWDYNPNTQWNSPWSNIDNNGNFLLFTSP